MGVLVAQSAQGLSMASPTGVSSSVAWTRARARHSAMRLAHLQMLGQPQAIVLAKREITDDVRGIVPANVKDSAMHDYVDASMSGGLSWQTLTDRISSTRLLARACARLSSIIQHIGGATTAAWAGTSNTITRSSSARDARHRPRRSRCRTPRRLLLINRDETENS